LTESDTADISQYKEVEDLTLEAIAAVKSISKKVYYPGKKFPRKFKTKVNEIYEKLEDFLVEIVEKIDSLPEE
jgi:hypothetical protein